MSIKLDRRRKYYMVLDCETATLPYAANFDGETKKTIAIAKPLIYDLGWTIIDRQGTVYDRKNFLITEVFSVPEVFNTAYYASKRPIYLNKLKQGEITLCDWEKASGIMVEAMNQVEAVGAYNSMFDFKKAIPFTELYISQLYSPNFQRWSEMQKQHCDYIAQGNKPKNSRDFDPEVFRYRNIDYPLFDLWGLSCRYILDNDEYRTKCVKNEWQTASGKYFKTSAETAFRFVTGEDDFDEAHTALNDAEIESTFFPQIMKKTKNKLEIGIEYFPFRLLGTVENFLARQSEL